MLNYVDAGIRIRAQRSKLGLTQEVVAERVNISPGYYSQIESGSRKAGLNTFVSISIVLSLSLDYIFGKEVPTLNKDCFDEFDIKIFNRLCTYPQKDKQFLLAFLKLFEEYVQS